MHTKQILLLVLDRKGVIATATHSVMEIINSTKYCKKQL